MSFQCRVELIRIAAHHCLVDQRAGATLRLGAEKHSPNDGGRMRYTFVNHDRVREIVVRQAHRHAEPLHQIGMRGLFDKKLHELVVDRRVAGILDHGESQPLIDRVVGKIMLQSKALESLRRQLAFPQFGEKTAIHQLVDSRLNNLAHE